MCNFPKSPKCGEEDAVTSSSARRDPVSSHHPTEAELLETVALSLNPWPLLSPCLSWTLALVPYWQPACFSNLRFLGHSFLLHHSTYTLPSWLLFTACSLCRLSPSSRGALFSACTAFLRECWHSATHTQTMPNPYSTPDPATRGKLSLVTLWHK